MVVTSIFHYQFEENSWPCHTSRRVAIPAINPPNITKKSKPCISKVFIFLLRWTVYRVGQTRTCRSNLYIASIVRCVRVGYHTREKYAKIHPLLFSIPAISCITTPEPTIYKLVGVLKLFINFPPLKTVTKQKFFHLNYNSLGRYQQV